MHSQMNLIIIKLKYDINHKNKAFFHSKFIYHHDKKTTKSIGVWWEATVVLTDLFEIVPMSMLG
jgi:hypothetical protein